MQTTITVYTDGDEDIDEIIDELKRRKVMLEKVDITTQQGRFEALNYGVSHTPIAVVKTVDSFKHVPVRSLEAFLTAK